MAELPLEKMSGARQEQFKIRNNNYGAVELEVKRFIANGETKREMEMYIQKRGG